VLVSTYLSARRTAIPTSFFCILAAGLLILEVKDWKPDTIQSMTKSDAAILTPRGLKHVLNPLEQARQYAHAVINVLERDKQLTFPVAGMEGRLMFPWAYGVVLDEYLPANFREIRPRRGHRAQRALSARMR
jgi:hypothetical protein